MKTISRRLQCERKKIISQLYDIKEGLSLVKQTASANFNESIEAHISLYIDPKYADQQLRTTVILPHGTGNTLSIAVLAQNDLHDEVKGMGVNIVGNEELLDEIKKGIINFDVLITSPDMMPKLAKLGKVLGPKGLMPSPKSGTVTNDFNLTIQEFKKGKLEYRADKGGVVHINFGKSDFSIDFLYDNLLAFYKSVENNKPAGVKGKYIKKFTICSTMGPGIPIDFNIL